MKWIIQKNFTERTFGTFIENVLRMGCDAEFVHLYPFLDKIFADDVKVDQIDEAPEISIDLSIPTVGIGSIKLNRILDERGVQPGGFRNETITFDTWAKGYGIENLLNGDSIITPFGQLLDHIKSDNVFLRPLQDDKAFAGSVFAKLFVERWIETVGALAIANSYSTVTLETLVTVASVKKIYAEYRSFIVDKKVITTSRYKLGDIVLSSTEVDDDVVEYTQSMVDLWQPCRAFVMDVAVTPEGKKIVELNGFGSSGYYACDVQKIIAAIEDMKI